ncbi:MAG TPA: translation initiation factor eIF-2B [Candidatus Acidoferrales bacterium]|nr:translation initiation factor eIF-2B [Candidatus Acidoferrales bacterium]
MKPELLERANRIAADNISSQQQILKDMLDLLMNFSAQDAYALNFIQDLKLLSTAIANAQLQMSALSNMCRLIVSASDKLKPGDINTYLKNLWDKIENSSSIAASKASKLISDGKSYATISQSEFVTKTFERASSENKHVTIFVMESRPLFEGRQTARALTKMGHRVILLSDASIGFFINEIDSAFVGADSILSDGTLINKIGSYPLAVCCADAKKKFYAVTSVLKYDSEKTSDDFVNKEESADEICANPEFSEGTCGEVRNFYFDKIKPELVTAIITETGSIFPSSELADLNSAMREIYG